MDIARALRVMSDLGATWILWLLVGLSLSAVTIVIERVIYFQRQRDQTAPKRKQLLNWTRTGRVREVVEALEECRGVEAQVALAALRTAGMRSASTSHAMDGASERARIQMERGLSFLGTVGSNAPFVGLLGTVIGIIRSFSMLDASNGRVSTGLMTEVGEALIATAVGILVALPAVAAFNYFQGVVKRRLSSARALAAELISHDPLAHRVLKAAE
ncbi:MAG: MotA/TolQ/ExbB proton channel family protein [Myxococcota bacterium]